MKLLTKDEHNLQQKVLLKGIRKQESPTQKVLVHECECGRINTLQVNVEKRKIEDKATTKAINTAYWCFCGNKEPTKFNSLDLKKEFNLTFDWGVEGV